MPKELLSTGEAAELCSVTPDTVLKWIHAGKIPAHRTPGGHHRIPLEAIERFLEGGDPRADGSTAGKVLQYCWEFNSSSDDIPDGCRRCIVFRSRSRRCYELTSLPSDSGYVGVYCEGNCRECDYYRAVRGQPPKILVVTDRPALEESLEREGGHGGFKLEFADCEYRCSMLIERFRPDYVVIDCALGVERSGEFTRLLSEDPRIPFVRIVLAGNRKDMPRECDRVVFAWIDRQFTEKTLSELISAPRQSLPEAAG
jgi:excisionase family DNA binding protein